MAKNVTTGHHAIIDAYNIPFEKANDLSWLLQLSEEAAIRAGATILGIHYYQFQPQGCSGILLISESHIAFHSFPELGFVAFDIYTCGSKKNFDLATGWIYQKLKETSIGARVVIQRIKRGAEINKG